MNELLPCPFCGKQPEQFSCMASELVRCVNENRPHCPASFGGVSVETWNRRAPAADAGELLAALEAVWRWRMKGTRGDALPEPIADIVRAAIDAARSHAVSDSGKGE